jgi:hypothetical protein
VIARAEPSRVARAARLLVAIASCLGSVVPCAAAQGPRASIQPSFRPDRLGAGTAFTFAFRLAPSEASVPPPLSSVVVRLPAGLGFNLGGVATCAPAALQRSGPGGCPARSVIGRGHALLEVHAGSQSITEEALVWALREPDRGGLRTFAIFGQGETPLQQQAISVATVSGDQPPYGSKLTVSVPPIPTIVYEPDASIVSFSMTVGGGARAHTSGTVTVPRRCPAGGFPFAALFTFADGASASAAARVRCP